MKNIQKKNLRVKKRYVSQDAEKYLADCSKLSALSKTRINIDRPLAIIKVSVN